MAIALIDLGKSIIARPKAAKSQPSRTIHWTKFDKPLEQMTQAERVAAAERLADEMLGVIKDKEK
jgi:hypothetical protein